jgi:hypothetical protein
MEIEVAEIHFFLLTMFWKKKDNSIDKNTAKYILKESPFPILILRI